MTQSEPSPRWQSQQHQRVLQHDPIAFAEICEQALSHLITFLQRCFPQYESHLHEMIATDTLLDYQRKPGQFDPDKLSLFAYLRMAARRDALNAIDKNKRRERRLFNIDDPAVQGQLPEQDTIQEHDEFEEWLHQYTTLSPTKILAALKNELNTIDEQILLLMLDGVRDSTYYAKVMGIDHRDETVQQREVKRAKDRLKKKLRRFGNRLNNL